jgi:hypothetical protein
MKTCIHTVIYKKYICTKDNQKPSINLCIKDNYCYVLLHNSEIKKERKRKTINQTARFNPHDPTIPIRPSPI